MRREILEHFRIRHERGPRERALEQVMTQQRVLGDTVAEHLFERIDVVQALAGEDRLPEEVLVDVRDRPGIRIEAAAARVDLLVERVVGPLRAIAASRAAA
jgi:hypothetical protein